ncbi:hypothetical protein FAI41_04570 [Acetobacteraceae bacterium]|nr:hypothetical protein FAI41_04570 [Acetobacteraceae bacterium]
MPDNTSSLPVSPYQKIFNHNDLSHIFLQTLEGFLSKTGYQIPAKVEEIHSNGTGEAGTVDVKPLLNLQTQDGKSLEQSVLYNVPYFRLQGGDSALIIDPQKGDIGQLILNGRDVSGLSSESDPNKPASFRLFDPNDCFFLPALFGKAAEQYIFSNKNGWTIHAKDTANIVLEGKEITISGNLKIKGNVSIEGDLTVKGKITAEEDILAGAQNISLPNHTHSVSAAPGITGIAQ